MIGNYYILVDREVVPVDFMAWARWWKDAERQVAETFIGKTRVSTVFLGLEHGFHDGRPVLFETMIFGGPLDGEQWRYSTYDYAEQGHEEAVTQARIADAKIRSIASKAGAT